MVWVWQDVVGYLATFAFEASNVLCLCGSSSTTICCPLHSGPNYLHTHVLSISFIGSLNCVYIPSLKRFTNNVVRPTRTFLLFVFYLMLYQFQPLIGVPPCPHLNFGLQTYRLSLMWLFELLKLCIDEIHSKYYNVYGRHWSKCSLCRYKEQMKNTFFMQR